MPTVDKDLEPVTDLKVAERYLRYGLEFHQIVSCYIEDAGLRFETVLTNVDPKALTISMEVTKESFAVLGYGGIKAIDRPQSEIRLSYSVNEATLFAHTKFQGRSAKTIYVKAEMPMYKMQRRDALRIKAMTSHNAMLDLGENTFPVYDISATGLSIVIDAEQEVFFTEQSLFPRSTLHFLGKDLKVDLEKKNVLKNGKDGRKLKVGLRFKALPLVIEQMIAREAYLISHKIWSRWL